VPARVLVVFGRHAARGGQRAESVPTRQAFISSISSDRAPTIASANPSISGFRRRPAIPPGQGTLLELPLTRSAAFARLHSRPLTAARPVRFRGHSRGQAPQALSVPRPIPPSAPAPTTSLLTALSDAGRGAGGDGEGGPPCPPRPACHEGVGHPSRERPDRARSLRSRRRQVPLGAGPQPGQSDADESADRRVGRQAAGCRERVRQ
jgi:hypothetical protein